MEEFLKCEWNFFKKLVLWSIVIDFGINIVIMLINQIIGFSFAIASPIILGIYSIYFIVATAYLTVKLLIYGFIDYKCEDINMRLQKWLSSLA